MKYNVNTLWTYCNSVQEYQCIEDILQLFNIYILVSCGIILIRRGSGVFFFDFLDTPQPGLIIFKKNIKRKILLYVRTSESTKELTVYEKWLHKFE